MSYESFYENLVKETYKKLWQTTHSFEGQPFSPVADGISIFLLSFAEKHGVTSEEFDHVLKELSHSYKQNIETAEDEK